MKQSEEPSHTLISHKLFKFMGILTSNSRQLSIIQADKSIFFLWSELKNVLRSECFSIRLDQPLNSSNLKFQGMYTPGTVFT